MLFLLGALSFEIWPLNPIGTDSENGGDYVEKPVMGRRPRSNSSAKLQRAFHSRPCCSLKSGRTCGIEKAIVFYSIALEAHLSAAETQQGVRFADVLRLAVPAPTLPAVQIVLPFPQCQAGSRGGRDECGFR